MRDPVLEAGLAGEVLETGVVPPALPKALVGEPVDLLQQHDRDHEARFARGPSPGREAVRHLPVDPVPVDLPGQPDRFMSPVDDLIEPCPKEIARALPVMFPRSHPMTLSVRAGESHSDRKRNPKSQGNGAQNPHILQSKLLQLIENTRKTKRHQTSSRTTCDGVGPRIYRGRAGLHLPFPGPGYPARTIGLHRYGQRSAHGAMRQCTQQHELGSHRKDLPVRAGAAQRAHGYDPVVTGLRPGRMRIARSCGRAGRSPGWSA